MNLIRITVEWGHPDLDDPPAPTDRDTHTERADPHDPPLGFGPHLPPPTDHG